MATEKIAAETRTEFGKGAARRIRRENKIPAVVYGHGNDPIHLTLPGHATMMAIKHGGANALLELEIDGKTQLALTKQVQVDPIKRTLEHIDFVAVRRVDGRAAHRHPQVGGVGELEEGLGAGTREAHGGPAAEELTRGIGEVQLDGVGDVRDLGGAGAGLGEGERHLGSLCRMPRVELVRKPHRRYDSSVASARETTRSP